MNKKLRILCLSSKYSGSASRVFESMFDGLTLYDPKTTPKMLKKGDVMFFDGGTDISTWLYGEESSYLTERPDMMRDSRERAAFILAQSVGAACIGVCRGAQLITALSGGKLLQHVSGHGQDHPIHTKGGEVIYATSTHHQMMWPKETNHELIAWAIHQSRSYCEYEKAFDPDKQPEIVWYPDTRSLAIQGHPEYLKYNDRFYQYCRELVSKYIIKESKS